MTAHGAPIAVPGVRAADHQTRRSPQNSAPLIQKGKQFGFYPRMSVARPDFRRGCRAARHGSQPRTMRRPRPRFSRNAGVYLVSAAGTAKLVDSRAAPDRAIHRLIGFHLVGAVVGCLGDPGYRSRRRSRHPIASNIPGRSTIVSLDVSHDGTRLLVYIATSSGPELIVAGIVRRAGVPTSLGPLLELPVSSAQPIDATWVDPTTVAALASSSGQDTVTSYVIGGSPSDAVDNARTRSVSSAAATRLASPDHVDRRGAGAACERLAGHQRRRLHARHPAVSIVHRNSLSTDALPQ